MQPRPPASLLLLILTTRYEDVMHRATGLSSNLCSLETSLRQAAAQTTQLEQRDRATQRSTPLCSWPKRLPRHA